jgi:hypothetical protein
MQRFLSVGDSTRAFNTLRKLALHDVSRCVLVGGLAVEFHCLRVGQPHAIRHLNDIDFVAPAFECILETLARDFLFRHVHPFDPPGKTIMQLVDADTSLRVDVFRADGGIMRGFCWTYQRLAELVKSSNMETAWQDHRKPTHPMRFGEADTLLKGLIATRRNLLFSLEYSKDTAEICPRCVRTPPFQLADPNVVLSLLGYC